MSAHPKTSRPPAVNQQSTDRALWDHIRQGSEAAWGILVRRYEALVYAIAVRAGLSMTEAGDCFQETWLLLYKNRHRIDTPDRLSAWITTTAKREALRLRRESRRFVEVSEEDLSSGVQSGPDMDMEALELRALLESGLQQIGERCEQLLRALFLASESASYDQLARDIGIPKNSLGPTRKRCLEKLYSIAAEEGWM